LCKIPNVPNEGENTTHVADLETLHQRVLRAAQIAVIDGPDAGICITCAGDVVSVGSGAGSDLRLSDPLVSRHHVDLYADAHGIRVTDRASRNGTFFCGARVTELLVSEDAELRVGGTRLAIRIEREPIKQSFSTRTSFGGAIAHSEALRHVFQLLEVAAPRDVTVLLEGESGTGKEVLATAIHRESHRREGPFVVVDCGSIPQHLAESELFGHEKGSFTGAVAAHAGAFERANGGTIFLDEIGELPLETQPKLGRALEARAVPRVGGARPIAFDVRVVAATNRRLREAVRCKEFREDLFYRLAVVHLQVPPLRDRRDDIPLLAERFLRTALSDDTARLPESVVRLLRAYDWPGNVRELRNVIDRFATFRNTDPSALFGLGATSGKDRKDHGLDIDALSRLPYAEAKRRMLDGYHRAVLPMVVEKHGGSVPKAAEALGMSRTNLYRVLQELSDVGMPVDDDG
jgi:two-component system, NtrC family, response regulator GlrR